MPNNIGFMPRLARPGHSPVPEKTPPLCCVRRHAKLTALLEGDLTRKTLGRRKMRSRIRRVLHRYKELVLLELQHPSLANW